ncbi:putative MAT1-1-1 protein [Acrodontium crateriforme]|uniref:Mating-type protein MAT-1 n=1 Tax=Acrodontium crateriforme TaxID=150365 RepID=A0AAQ3M5S2_9PEZI|nr:putative MAT1-1-1 protein [Acrodontium crateriforme]
MATFTALPADVQNYLASCSPEHADQIIQTLRAAHRRIHPEENTDVETGMKVRKIPTTSKAAKKQRKKKATRIGEVATGGPKRPLNSWMAFRKYYNGSLSPNTQKAISKILTSWWRDDPFEAKWVILAKAYSTLRGSREKEEAPLDEFLNLCASRIGVIPPEQYQQMMGWHIDAPQAGDPDKVPQVTRLFIPNLDNFPQKYISTDQSVNDLVTYCINAGYINNNNKASSAGVHDVLTMANLAAGANQSFMPVQVAGIPSVITTTGLNGDAVFTMPASLLVDNVIQDFSGEAMPPTIDAMGKAILESTNSLTNEASNFPHNEMFDPTMNLDVSFNPSEENEVVGEWNAFDLTANMTIDEMLSIDWTQFVNDDGLA